MDMNLRGGQYSPNYSRKEHKHCHPLTSGASARMTYKSHNLLEAQPPHGQNGNKMLCPIGLV